MVIESVFEDLQLKKDLFNQMGEILKQRSVPADQMLLCSNTMNLSYASRGSNPSLADCRWICRSHVDAPLWTGSPT